MLALCPVQLLLTSRKRPSWATSRRLLYGDIYEIGRSLLAMSQEEAEEVLAHRRGSEASGLVALADGWPAVIGLAALTDEIELPDEGVPEALYDTSPRSSTRPPRRRCSVASAGCALAPSLGEGVAEFLLGKHAAAVISEGVRLGFLTARSGTLELHPLLRTFLDAKTREQTAETKADAERLARRLAELGLWDDAFTLVDGFFSENLFVAILESGLRTMLAEARLATLAGWIELAEARHVDAPIIDLAEAEIAFHKGSRGKSEALAMRATRRLRTNTH